MRRVILSVCATVCSLFILTSMGVNNNSTKKAGKQILAHWLLNPDSDAKFILDDISGKYNLTESVSINKGTWSGFSKSYFSALDMRNVPWTFEGYFQTATSPEKAALIAGTRSSLSGYTGWGFSMWKDGTLRILAVNNAGKSAMIRSAARRFDDGKKHHFSINWEPGGKGGQIVLKVDNYKYSATGVGDLGENSQRRFEIGCQASNDKKLAIWEGSLSDFKFTGMPQTARNSELKIQDMDPAMRTSKSVDPTIKWIEGTQLTIEGKGWVNTALPYYRLPLKYKSIVRSNVWALSTCSAGIAIHFTASNTTFISARWKLRHPVFMPQMTPLGHSGLDLYVKLDGKWQWMGVGRPGNNSTNNEADLKKGIPANKKFEYMLYLPLYSSVQSLQLGFSSDATVEKAERSGKPLVFYGTSITQGCSASRPGMSYPAILGRRFDLPEINLGFSGNGTMDPEFADILADIPASAYIIDCLPNMGSMKTNEICDRTVYLVENLRAKRPETPIVLLEDRTYPYPKINGDIDLNSRREGLKMAYQKLLKDNVKKLYYIPGEGLIGFDNDATIDGSHPTDLGMFRYCQIMEPVLRKALGK